MNNKNNNQSAKVTQISSVRSRKKNVAASNLGIQIQNPKPKIQNSSKSSIKGAPDAISVMPEQLRTTPVVEVAAEMAAPRDRAAESLASAGLVDDEINRLKASLAILPIDTELVGRARAFVTAHSAGWSHDEWKVFIGELAQAGYAIGVDRSRYAAAQQLVGVLIETIRTTKYRVISEEFYSKAA